MSQVVPEVGMMLYTSWGYEQTNIDFYKIVRVNKTESGYTVYLQQWDKVIEPAEFLAEYVMPGDKPATTYKYERDANGVVELVNNVEAPVFRKKWKGDYAAISPYAYAWVFDNKPKYATHYH
jgi:hypothetical protein